jgi:O-methyltransferase involved in polyketide biosynthesis
MKQQIALGAVQETMLITLYGRAVAARTGGAVLNDPRAVDIVEALDYDFHRFAGQAPLGAVLRTRMLDDMARAFLAHFPAATVVEIGAGLNARFERLDNATLRWVDVDLPDAMRLRRQFFSETARRRMVASSVTESAWTDAARALGGPHLLIAEGVFGYLREEEVKDALARIADALPGSILAFDVSSSRSATGRRGDRVWPGLRPRIGWTCEDPRHIEGWGLGYRLLESRALADMARAQPLPWSLHYSLAVARILGWKTDEHRVNVYRADQPHRTGRIDPRALP